ncbi:hypothetical protein HDU67_002267 [Dinochytrium kinnereticum]|nr:hypothetical protein HDU67_002267 [Dinochytrium kinnereticum]
MKLSVVSVVSTAIALMAIIAEPASTNSMVLSKRSPIPPALVFPRDGPPLKINRRHNDFEEEEEEDEHEHIEEEEGVEAEEDEEGYNYLDRRDKEAVRVHRGRERKH